VTQEQSPPAGPDLTHGVALTQFTDQKLLGHVGDREILLVQSEAGIFAVEAHCTHYHGPLAEGLCGESIRCPWHHACFNLRSGEAEHAPATAPLASWRVEQEGELIFVRETPRTRKDRSCDTALRTAQHCHCPAAGAAGFAAAEMLRREGFAGQHRHVQQRPRMHP